MTIVLAALLAAAPVTLEADPNHSTVGFSVKHMVATTVRGQFTRFSSTVDWNRDDPAKSSVELKVDPSSINTNNEKRDGHLKSADFFDVQGCPDMSFRSRKIDKSGDKYKVTGTTCPGTPARRRSRSEEHTSELQSRLHLVCRLLLEKKKTNRISSHSLTTPPLPLINSSTTMSGLPDLYSCFPYMTHQVT